MTNWIAPVDVDEITPADVLSATVDEDRLIVVVFEGFTMHFPPMVVGDKTWPTDTSLCLIIPAARTLVGWLEGCITEALQQPPPEVESQGRVTWVSAGEPYIHLSIEGGAWERSVGTFFGDDPARPCVKMVLDDARRFTDELISAIEQAEWDERQPPIQRPLRTIGNASRGWCRDQILAG